MLLLMTDHTTRNIKLYTSRPFFFIRLNNLFLLVLFLKSDDFVLY